MSEKNINSKRVEINERKFEVQKMNAFESIAVLKELLTRAMPFDILSALGGEASKLFDSPSVPGIGLINGNKKDMSIDEFVLLEKRILQYSFEVLPSGLTQVVNKNGDFMINDAEQDIFLVMQLLVEVVRINYESFFIEMLQKIKVIAPITSEQTSETI